MGVVTNKPGMFTEALLDRMGMATSSTSIVSGDTTAHKSSRIPMSPSCTPAACSACVPDRNLHIGDSENDIHAARAAGCRPSCVPYGYNEGKPVDSADCDALVSTALPLTSKPSPSGRPPVTK